MPKITQEERTTTTNTFKPTIKHQHWWGKRRNKKTKSCDSCRTRMVTTTRMKCCGERVCFKCSKIANHGLMRCYYEPFATTPHELTNGLTADNLERMLYMDHLEKTLEEKIKNFVVVGQVKKRKRKHICKTFLNKN